MVVGIKQRRRGTLIFNIKPRRTEEVRLDKNESTTGPGVAFRLEQESSMNVVGARKMERT